MITMAKLLPSWFSLISVIKYTSKLYRVHNAPNIQMVQTNHVNRAYHHSKVQCSHTVRRSEIYFCTAVSEKGDDEVHPIISMVFDKNMQRGITILVPLVRIDAWLQQNLTKMLHTKSQLWTVKDFRLNTENKNFRSLQVHCNHAQAYM